MRHPTRRVLLLILVANQLSACASARRMAPVPAIPSPLTGFRAAYRVAWTENGRVRKARLAAVYSPPRRLRLEILDPLGASRLVLLASGDQSVLLDVPDREYRRYAGGRDAIKALSGIGLDADLLAALLLGNPSTAPGLKCSLPGEGRQDDMSCEGPAGDPAIQVRRGGEAWEVRSSGCADLHVEMGFPPGSSRTPPRRIRMRQGTGEVLADLELEEFLFAAPEEDLFSLQPPPSFRDASGDPSRPIFW